MHRIDKQGNVNGLFVMGDPENGILPTRFGADWPNAVQEEIVNVITSAGIELEKSNNNQLLEAIEKKIPSRLQVVIPTGDSVIYLPIEDNSIYKLFVDFRTNGATEISRLYLAKAGMMNYMYLHTNDHTADVMGQSNLTGNVAYSNKMIPVNHIWLNSTNYVGEESLIEATFYIKNNRLRLAFYQVEHAPPSMNGIHDGVAEEEHLFGAAFAELNATDFLQGIPLQFTGSGSTDGQLFWSKIN